MSHLSSTTVFEALDDHGVRTAGTTYLIYRGRHEQQVSRRGGLTRLARTIMREPVLGPRELFYADIFESRPTECRSQLGLPGVRDRHAGCVGAELVTGDLFDFLLLSLPDNDSYSHKRGPEAQITSIAHADRQLMRIAQAAGGLDEFLDRYALIATADHGHAPVRARAELRAPFDNLGVLEPTTSGNGDPQALSRCARRSATPWSTCSTPTAASASSPTSCAGRGPWTVSTSSCIATAREGVIAAAGGRGGELRFAPGGDLVDARGRSWSIDGDLGVIAAEIHDGLIDSDEYPDPLARVWSALTCAQSGEVLLSAADGLEFPDWGGAAHVGGGSHGSLHRSDSLGALMFCGVRAAGRLSARRRVGDRGRRQPVLCPLRCGYPVCRWLRAVDDRRRRHRSRAGAPPRPPRAAQAGQLVRAAALRDRRRQRLRRQPGRLLGARTRCRRELPRRGDGRVPRRGHQQLLVEPRLDVPGPRRPRRLPGRALLRRQRRSRS